MHETMKDQAVIDVRDAVKASRSAGRLDVDTRSMCYWLERLGNERMRRSFSAPEDLEAQAASAFKYLMLGEIIEDNRDEAMQYPFPERQIYALQTLYMRAVNAADQYMDCAVDRASKRIMPGKENFFRLALTGENLLHVVNEEDYNGRLDLDPFESSVLYGVQYLFADYPPYVDMYESLAWGVYALQDQRLDLCR